MIERHFLEETKMKNITLTLMGLVAFSMGCKKDCDTGDGCDTGFDEVEPEAAFSMTWGADNVVAAVANGDEAGYFFGFAETGAGTTGWYGEDCMSADSICHEVIASTTLACASGIDGVLASSATLHCGVEAATSWAFWGGADWATLLAAGGDDASYFGG